MNSSLKIFLYIAAGIIVATIAVKVLWVLLRAVGALFHLVVSIGVVLVIGYIIYSLIKAAIRAVR